MVVEENPQRLESKSVTDHEALAVKKRAEIAQSLDQRLIQDPVTLVIMAGVAIGTHFLSKALAPKPPMQQVGLMKGTIQLQSSQQGTFIPEIYGAAPSVSLVAGVAVTWSNLVNVTTGANGLIRKNAGTDQVWNAGAVLSTAVAAADDAFIEVILDDSPSTFSASAAGFCTSTNPTSGQGVGGAPNLEFGVLAGVNVTGTDEFSNPIISHSFKAVINGVGGPDLGSWTPGDKFRVEKRSGGYHLYKGFAEVSTFTPPTPTANTFLAMAGWRTGFGLLQAFAKVGGDIGLPPSAGSGGCKVPAMITWATQPKKHSFTTNQPTGGGKGHSSGTTPVENIYYTISLGAMFSRGPVVLIREYANSDVLLNFDPNLNRPTGVYDPTVPNNPTFDPQNPPDPKVPEMLPLLRSDGDLLIDGEGVGSGTIQQGSSNATVYPGNFTQQPDPTEEADVDARNGPGSTVAYRGHSRIVHTDLNMQRWQNIPPNLTAVWQHESLVTLGPIYASLCARPVDRNGDPLLAPTDYDFSSLNGVLCRGMLLDGRRFSPAEVIDNPELQDVYNYFTTEGDGKILAYLNGTEPSVTIPETELGWLNGSDRVPEVFPHLVVTQAEETRLSFSVDLSYIDPGSDWEKNTQRSVRRVTDGNNQEFLSVQVTLNADEARTATDRRLFREYVAGSVARFSLSWKYRYLYAGYKITVPTASGITYVMRLKSAVGGIGVIDCEAEFLEVSAFTQSGVGSIVPTYNPSQPTPAVTILAAMDVPAWRPEDFGKFGMYFAGTPRNTDVQTWQGFYLAIKRGVSWGTLGTFKTAAIMGVIAAATALGSDPNVTDNAGSITVDLYGSKAALSSVTEADMIAGINRAVAGDMILGFASAVKVPNFPNRWTISTLRNGQFNTQEFIGDPLVGRNFCVLDDSVQFIELDPEKDFQQTITLKAVSIGASLPDTAEVDTFSNGQSAKAETPATFSGTFDLANGSVLMDWVDETLLNPTAKNEYEFEIRNGPGEGAATVRGPLIINPLELARISGTPPLKAFTGGGMLPLNRYTWIAPGGFDATYNDAGGEWDTFALVSLVESESTFSIKGGFMLEVQVSEFDPLTGNLFPSFIGIVPTVGSPTLSNSAAWSKHGSINPDVIVPLGAPIDNIRHMVPNDRFTIQISPDGTVSYYQNYLGASSDPWYVAPATLDPNATYKLQMRNDPYPTGGSSHRVRVRNTRWLRNSPEFIYTGDMQKADNGGSLPATVYARVRKRSSIYPVGAPSDWKYGTFVRP